MTGFAGETDEEFERSLSFAEKTGFSRIHVFTYSVREGTAAARRNDHISENVKAQRYARMSALASRLYSDHLKSRIGSCDTVLIQKRTSPEFAAGLTPDYTPVRIYGSRAERHDIIKIRIVGAGEGFCVGEEE